MSKRYSPASEDVERKIASLRAEHYAEDAHKLITIGALFVADESGKPVLTHKGYPAAAVARIVGARDRAAGMPDAQIVIDLAVWQTLALKQQYALLDHELYHLTVKLDSKGSPKFDAQGRPKLEIRKHDWQFGWFDEIAQRHGVHSMERIEAKHLVEASGQLYFDFTSRAAA